MLSIEELRQLIATHQEQYQIVKQHKTFQRMKALFLTHKYSQLRNLLELDVRTMTEAELMIIRDLVPYFHALKKYIAYHPLLVKNNKPIVRQRPVM